MTSELKVDGNSETARARRRAMDGATQQALLDAMALVWKAGTLGSRDNQPGWTSDKTAARSYRTSRRVYTALYQIFMGRRP